jgi:propanediol dehydratase small subunit
MKDKLRYPLMDHAADEIQAASGRRVSDVNLESLAEDQLTPDDLQIHAETLRTQAEIAHQAGYPQLAANLLRAAELTTVPSDEVLQIYELLRPERASFEQLSELADYLEKTYHAVETANLVRQAAKIYLERTLLRK